MISGPSGVGKTTVCKELLKFPGFERVVTCTTRPPREGEVDGRDYMFLSPKEFEEGVRAGRFLEHARVHGHFYGTPRSPVERGLSEGKDMLLSIDVQGAAQIRGAFRSDQARASDTSHPGWELVTIFLEPPSRAELERRLTSRGTDDPDQIRARLDVAETELRERDKYDLTITNVEVERTVREILDHLGYGRGFRPGTGTAADSQARCGETG